MTSVFYIKLKAFFDVYFKSYESQCFCIFSSYVFKKYGNSLQIRIRYYQPSRISVLVSSQLLQHFLSNILLVSRSYLRLQITPELSRIISPVQDASILAQYLSSITDSYNFHTLCWYVKIRILESENGQYEQLTPEREEKHFNDPLSSNEKVQGLEVILRGRIPTEKVRPRTTVQSRILGKKSVRNVNINPLQTYRVHGVNPALGAFSIWIRLVV